MGRLEAVEAAPAGGQADRAAGVRAQRQRRRAARDRDGRPAARAAGHALGVARVARQRLAVVARHRHAPRELVRGRLADHDRAGGPRAADALGVAPPARGRRRSREPRAVSTPSVSIRSLTASGTPHSGPVGSPRAHAASAARASARARSRHRAWNAPRRGSIRASQSCERFDRRELAGREAREQLTGGRCHDLRNRQRPAREGLGAVGELEAREVAERRARRRQLVGRGRRRRWTRPAARSRPSTGRRRPRRCRRGSPSRSHPGCRA